LGEPTLTPTTPTRGHQGRRRGCCTGRITEQLSGHSGHRGAWHQEPGWLGASS